MSDAIPLPRDLAPWSALLSLFAPDLAGDLGRLLPRLALAIGPMRSARPARSGEPDGFSGVARRGSYERLLLSEWLLADELPDEFARRASMGEHTFFEIARRTPARASSSVAIFASGPEVIGAPRIAELAALIVLAARAEKAKARFAWGIAEQEHALYTEVTPATVRRLLGARTAVGASEADFAAWIDRAQRSGWEDVWLVGAGPPRVWPHATLTIHDVLDPDRRALSVIARAPGSAPREIELDLPGVAACVRLLRDPFYVAPAPAPPPQRTIKKNIAARSNLIFAENGTKVFSRGPGGTVIAYPVPNSRNQPPGKPKSYHAHGDGAVTAVGWVRRGLVLLTVSERDIIIKHAGRSGPGILNAKAQIPEGVRVVPASDADPLSPIAYREDSGEDALYFLDARRALFRVRGPRGWSPKVTIEQIASEVSAICVSPAALTYVARDLESDAPPRKLVLGPQTIPPAPPQLDPSFSLVELRSDGKSSTRETLVGDGSFAAFFGASDRLAAIQQRGEAWSIPPRGGIGPAIEITPPPGARVVGVHQRGAASEPELIVLGPDRRALSYFGRSSGRALPSAEAPISDVATCPARGSLAYATEEGEVVIRSLDEDAPLVRFGAV